MEYIHDVLKSYHMPKSGLEHAKCPLYDISCPAVSKIISFLHLSRRGIKWCHEEIFQGIPRPSSQPPSGRLAMISGMLEFDITYASCVLPGNRQLMLRNLKHEYSIVWSYRIEKCIVLHMNYICKWTALYKYVYSVWTNLISASTTPCVLRAWKFFLDT